MNPYFNTTFFEWFQVAFERAYLFISGQAQFSLASDEVQALVLAFFALNASILGSFLVIKRLTMMANAISHTMVLGIVFAYLFSSSHTASDDHSTFMDLYPSETSLFLFSGLIAILTAFLTQVLSRHRLIREDASNAIVFTSLFAIGITLVSTLTKNAHAGGELLMGNPDALVASDIPRVAISTVVSCLAIVGLYRGLSVALFDEMFGKMAGLRPQVMVSLLLLFVSMTLVTSFRAVGFVMSLAFFVTPSLIARLYSHSMKQLIGISSLIAIFSSLSSVALTRHILTMYNIALSTGAFAVSWLVSLYLLALLVRKGKSLMRRTVDQGLLDGKLDDAVQSD